jgi:hypothetical protein
VEVVIAPNVAYVASTADLTFGPGIHFLPVGIPKGSRVSIRTQSTKDSLPDRLTDFVLTAFATR